MLLTSSKEASCKRTVVNGPFTRVVRAGETAGLPVGETASGKAEFYCIIPERIRAIKFCPYFLQLHRQLLHRQKLTRSNAS